MRSVLGIFTLGSCVFALALGMAAGYPRIIALAANSDTTSGVVTSAEPEDHQSIHVRYVVADRSQEIVWDGFPSVAVGQPMVVYYLPSDPSNASLVRPRDLLLQATLQLTILSLLFGLVATYAVFALRRRFVRR